MHILRQWFSSSSPTVKTLMAISITSVLLLSHKMYFAPFLKRRRYESNETWANMIIEHEETVQESLENK